MERALILRPIEKLDFLIGIDTEEKVAYLIRKPAVAIRNIVNIDKLYSIIEANNIFKKNNIYKFKDENFFEISDALALEEI